MTTLSKAERKYGRRASLQPNVIADLSTPKGRLTAFRSPRGGVTVKREVTVFTRNTLAGRFRLIWLLSESPMAGAPELGRIGERVLCKLFQLVRALVLRVGPALAIATAIGWTMLTRQVFCG